MSNKNKGQKPENNIIAISRCLAEDCAKKSQRADFCDEHFAWFKAGLINKKGEKVKDFERKLQHFTAKAS